MEQQERVVEEIPYPQCLGCGGGFVAEMKDSRVIELGFNSGKKGHDERKAAINSLTTTEFPTDRKQALRGLSSLGASLSPSPVASRFWAILHSRRKVQISRIVLLLCIFRY